LSNLCTFSSIHAVFPFVLHFLFYPGYFPFHFVLNLLARLFLLLFCTFSSIQADFLFAILFLFYPGYFPFCFALSSLSRLFSLLLCTFSSIQADFLFALLFLFYPGYFLYNLDFLFYLGYFPFFFVLSPLSRLFSLLPVHFLCSTIQAITVFFLVYFSYLRYYPASTFVLLLSYLSGNFASLRKLF
jgi:hypothetical protein